MSTQTKRVGAVVGIAAAAAVGVAAMASTAFAPTARADDFSEIVASVQGDFTAGDALFASALSDFNGDAGLGLTQFFSAVDDYTLSAPDNLLIGSLDALTGVPIVGSIPNELADAPSLSAAFTYVETLFQDYSPDFSVIGTYLADGNYADAAYLAIALPQALTVGPVEELLIGAVNSL